MKWYSLLLVVALAGCGGGSGVGSIFDPDIRVDIDVPFQIELPPSFVTNPRGDTGETVLRAQNFDLADVGYVEQEYFLEGTARSFRNVNEFLNDGLWEAEPADEAPYKIRIVVHKPADLETPLNGLVVEWMNPSQGFDLPVCWGLGHVEMYRRNYVWVGVSAQAASIEGGPLSLKSVNPERYASLSHPGDSFSYDIFAQASRAVGNSRDGVDVLDGRLRPIPEACGHGEAADRLVTFINAVIPIYLPQIFPELMIVGRSGGAAPLSQPPQADIPTPDAPQIRADTNRRVLSLQSETDVTTRGSAASRQEDTAVFRLWEVAGTANLDYYGTEAGRDDSTGDSRFAAIVEEDTIEDLGQCNLPVNAGPMHYAFNRALEAVSLWQSGAPPGAERLQLDEQGNLVMDSNGNALGGLRTPYVDAPAANLSGLGNSGTEACDLLGTTSLFAADRMASLYIDQDGYVQAVTEAANAAVAARFLLRRDADAIIEWAPSQWQAQVGQ